MNLYGYASGDPVNFSDPFGLCPVTAEDPTPCGLTGAAIGTVAGAGLGVALTAGCAGITVGICSAAAPVIIGASAGLGGAIGGLIETIFQTEGRTASGGSTDEHGNELGPSGKPKIHEVDHSTKKQAKDAARNEGKGAPVQHPSPTRGRPHFHPTDGDGEKVPGSTHHNYPD